MADKTPDQEPSIEEILASIRQIISDDEDKDSGEAPEAPPAPKPEPVVEEEEDDVLELTQPIPPEPPVAAPPAAPEFEIDLQDHAPEPVAEVKMPPSDILTDAARNATISSMAKLAGNMPITRHREYGNITLEDLVREMLHPMLKDWLSDNLPPMVERVVQRELEKLARQAQDV